MKNHKVKFRHLIPKQKKGLKIILILLAVLVVIRLALPYVVLKYVNRTLASSLPGYYGHVEDINIALIRGAYKLNNIYINKIDSTTNQQISFFRSQIVDLSLEWKALFHGKIVGKMIFDEPMLRFTKDKTEPAQVQKDTSDFRVVLKKLMPLDVNRFEIRHGIIAYRDSGSKPPVILDMTETYILAQNLKNSYDSASVLPATVKATANLYQGHLNFDMKLNPLAANPTYVMKAELVNTNLADFNSFFLAYGKFDINRGNLGIYSEMAAADGRFKGYVKPVITDLKVIGPQDKNENFMHQLWEHIVAATATILTNPSKDQFATKIPIEGSYSSPNTGIMDAIIGVLRNAFIQAFIPAIDNEINLSSVTQPEEKKGFFRKLFEKKNAADKKVNT